MSGEEINYQYDSLMRLTSAVTTGPEWGQTFTYDGFGNLLAQTVTKGLAPSMSVSVEGSTNRLTGSYGYDANGNLTYSPSLGTLSYDIDNRLTNVSGEQYGYGPNNQRVWKKKASGVEELHFHGIDGRRLAVYSLAKDQYGASITGAVSTNAYFAGRLVGPVTDRLGSVKGSGSSVSTKYYPYGVEYTTTAQETDKFATYYRDGTGLDYAQQRYYENTLGRFLTPDPSKTGAGPRSPGSWNRYAYVEGDPANGSDHLGLNRDRDSDENIPPEVEPINCGDLTFPDGTTLRNRILAQSDAGLMARIIWHESTFIAAIIDNGGNLTDFYYEKEMIGLAMLNRWNIANGNLALTDINGNLIDPSSTGFGPLGISLNEVMLIAAGKNQAWSTGNNAILNASQTDLADRFIATINSVLNSPFRRGKQFTVHGIFGDFTVNSACYQLSGAVQAANAVLTGVYSQRSGGSVPVFWNLSSRANPGLAHLIVNLGSAAGSSTNFWGFVAGYPIQH